MLSRWKLAVARTSVVLGLVCLFAGLAIARSIPTSMPGSFRRNVGPFRAGRISAVSAPVGPGQAGIFLRRPAGGRRVEDRERRHDVVSDLRRHQDGVVGRCHRGGAGDPNIIYAGTGDLVGEGAIDEGDGVYKSTDAGKTWVHLGLEATKQIPALIVDPKNPNLVLLAAQGDVHHPCLDRGMFRCTDGGQDLEQDSYVDDDAGGQESHGRSTIPT